MSAVDFKNYSIIQYTTEEGGNFRTWFGPKDEMKMKFLEARKTGLMEDPITRDHYPEVRKVHTMLFCDVTDFYSFDGIRESWSDDS